MTMGYSNNGHVSLFLLIISMFILASSSPSRSTFNVGGKGGWVIKPQEDYCHWAQRNRFQVNDTLYFKYKKGSDSVLRVKKEDYDSCNTKNPIHKMDDGDSKFTFDRSGPFFFISGNVENCQRGQKLIVVVLAVRHKHSTESLPPAPAPVVNGSFPSSNVGPSGPSSAVASLPKHSGSTRFRSVGVALGVSVGVGLFVIILG